MICLSSRQNVKYSISIPRTINILEGKKCKTVYNDYLVKDDSPEIWTIFLKAI